MSFRYAVIRPRRGAPAAALILVCLLGALFTVRAVSGPETVDVPVIMYHSVLKDEKYHGKYVISPSELEDDLKYLKENGYTSVTAADLIAYTRGGSLPEKPVVLTFDDGYYNNYLYAFPLLKEYGFKAVISPIGYYSQLYSDTPDENAYYSHCTWEELAEMAASGVFEVQNHSYDLHRTTGRMGMKKLSGESAESYERLITEDLTAAQRAIEENVGTAPTAIAYPFGAYGRDTEAVVREMGFLCSFSCEERVSAVSRDPESLYGLGRFLRPSGTSVESILGKITGGRG